MTKTILSACGPCVALAAFFLISVISPACAADPTKTGTAKSTPMKMDEPMAGEMKKEGMKKGDVKKAAEKKDREMRQMLEKEQQAAGAVKK
jgi:pentapeptide MXKDX repeat protein